MRSARVWLGRRRVLFPSTVFVLIGAVLLAVGLVPGAADLLAIRGVVVDELGPVLGATVRIQATDNATTTDHLGRFELGVPGDSGPITVSAWKHGYYCAKTGDVRPPESEILVKLRRYQTTDNPDYTWMVPISDDPQIPSCALCKSAVTDLWLDNAHAGAAQNPRFLSMYNGTDLLGNQSPPTRYGFSRDYGSFPLPPDPRQPYYGPGYKLDFPDTAGNCAACHIPGAAVDAPYGVDPNDVAGVDDFGVHCDYCHKVADVILNPVTARPYDKMPGVLSSDVRRPFEDDPDRYQLFFGPFDDDNVPEEDTYLPLIQESAFCAPCHYGVFWDTLVYNSYGEWLDSPYSDPETGQTCQDCHMPAPSLVDDRPITNVAPGEGGVERDPETIRAHAQLGATHERFLQEGLTLSAHAEAEGGSLVVTVEIFNDNTGHHYPTDSPLRHLILIVDALDESGEPLLLVTGSRVPDWCGEGSRDDGYYAGLPGKAFAKVLEELWTGVSPTGAYWNMTRLVSDNRIAAMATDSSEFTFELGEARSASIHVALLFRRAFIELMEQKAWQVPDILIGEATLLIEHSEDGESAPGGTSSGDHRP